jgi:hypothetical protein
MLRELVRHISFGDELAADIAAMRASSNPDRGAAQHDARARSAERAHPAPEPRAAPHAIEQVHPRRRSRHRGAERAYGEKAVGALGERQSLKKPPPLGGRATG